MAHRGAQETPAAPISGAGQRNTPFSSHSRGVQLFDAARVCDIGRHVGHFGRELRDISSSFLVLLTIQPWLTAIAMAVTIGSVSCALGLCPAPGPPHRAA